MSEQLLNTKLSPQMIAFIQRWVNLHRVLWILTIGCFFAAWNRGLALLYGVFSLILALLLISYLLPRLQLKGVRIKRLAVDEFTVGKPGVLKYQIECSGRRYHLELKENIIIAGSQNANPVFFSRVNGSATGELKFTCEHRGCFLLHDITLLCAYPFGIIPYEKKVSTNPIELLVFPKVYEFNQIPLPTVADTTTVGSVLLPHQGGCDEFAAVREYSHGDELKRIHWAASARLQHLVVKEYDRTDKPTLLIALDCRPDFSRGKSQVNTFEYSISIAASMIHYASRQGIQSYLLADDGHWQELLVPAYSSDLYTLYEVLARLNGTGTDSSETIISHAQKRLPQANLIVGFRLSETSLQPQVAPHATLIDITMEGSSFLLPAQAPRPAQTHRIGNELHYHVFASTPLETLFQ